MRSPWLGGRGSAVLAVVLLAGGPRPASAQAGTAALPATPPLAGGVARISVLGVKNVPADTLRAVLVSKVGAPYSPQTAPKDIAALQGTGLLTGPPTVAAAADPAGGVDLAYTVVENPIVSAVRFTADTPTGQPSVPAADLLAQMKTQPGQVLNTNTVVSDVTTLFSLSTGYFAKRGFRADVGTGINYDPQTGVVNIPLKEYRIQSIQFTGNSRVKAADILARMHTKVGDVYDGAALNEDESAVYEMGAFREVSSFTGAVTGPGKIAITIPVVEQAPATGGLDEKRGKVIPFRFDPLTVPYLVVRVSVNGHPPLPFVVDTGASPALSLDPWAAKELDLPPGAPAGRLGGLPSRRVPVRGVVLQGAGHGNDVSFNPKEARVLDLSILSQSIQGPRVAGIVGMGLFQSLTTRFDFASRTITMFADPHPPLNVPGATVLPLRVAPDIFTARTALTLNTFADLVLDTGSPSTQVPLETIAALHPTATAFDMNGHLNALYVSPVLRLPSLSLGTLRVPDVTVGTMPAPASASLGLDILARYRLTLDGPNGQALLEPSAHPVRYRHGWSGVGLKPISNGWRVRDIRPGSPAQKGGLRAGDELMSVGGIGVQGMSLVEIRKMLAGMVGTPVRVSLRRGAGQALTAAWVSVDKFSAPPDPPDGLTMRRANGGPWVVIDVLKGCAGERAGLAAGDRITRMGGVSVASLSPVRCAEMLDDLSFLDGRPLLLTVTRAGRAQPFTVRLAAPGPDTPAGGGRHA